MPPSRYRWVILVLAYLCMLGFAFPLQSLPPVLTLIIRELRLTHTEAGLLMSLFALPSIFFAILAGSVSDRWGPFKTGVISLVLVTVGMLIFAVSTSFLWLGFGRVVAGVGAATIAIVAPQIISQWFREHGPGTAMGIFNTAMPVGTIICFASFGRLAELLGWRIPMVITAMISTLALVSFLLLYRPSPNPSKRVVPEKKEKAGRPLVILLKIGLPIWLIGFCWMWFNAAVISFSSFAPDFFVSKGYSLAFAGFLASLLMWGSLVLSPVVGRLVDKVGNNDLFIAVGGIVLASAIYLVTRSTNFFFPMILMAIAVALVPAPVFSSPSRILEPKNLGLGFGILAMASGTGMFFGPYIAGFVRDKTGSYEMSFIFLSILALLTTVTALILRVKMKRD